MTNAESPGEVTQAAQRAWPAVRAPSAGALWRRCPPQAVSAAAASLLFAAFFLPWMQGSGPFELRAFSGFDFARLVRNFEIVADSTSASARVRGTAVAVYLLPALAANGALLHLLSGVAPAHRRLAGRVLVGAGGYAALLLGALLFLSVVPVNDFASAVGLPTWGFGLSAASAVVLMLVGRWEIRRGRGVGGE